TLMASLTIPDGYYGLLHNAQVFVGLGKSINAAFMQRPEGGIWRTVKRGIFVEASNPWFWNSKRFDQHTDLEIRAFVSSVPEISVTANFNMTMVKLNNDVADLSVPSSIHYQGE
ncbi:hypothetical protein KA005_33675, partial [bacterium]|nr:hypothetical protein [bacterium]